ncbi:MAG: hypothetical protein ACSLEL_02550 [Candidatus Malihini olakiniferum]
MKRLLEDKGIQAKLLRAFKEIVHNDVFNNTEVEKLELQSYRVIDDLLNSYHLLLEISYNASSVRVNVVNNDKYPHYLH